MHIPTSPLSWDAATSNPPLTWLDACSAKPTLLRYPERDSVPAITFVSRTQHRRQNWIAAWSGCANSLPDFSRESRENRVIFMGGRVFVNGLFSRASIYGEPVSILNASGLRPPPVGNLRSVADLSQSQVRRENWRGMADGRRLQNCERSTFGANTVANQRKVSAQTGRRCSPRPPSLSFTSEISVSTREALGAGSSR